MDTVEMANAFNNYFSNIGCEITSLISSVNKSPLHYLNKNLGSKRHSAPTC